jgi:hypothetical protein
MLAALASVKKNRILTDWRSFKLWPSVEGFDLWNQKRAAYEATLSKSALSS